MVDVPKLVLYGAIGAGGAFGIYEIANALFPSTDCSNPKSPCGAALSEVNQAITECMTNYLQTIDAARESSRSNQLVHFERGSSWHTP